MPKFLLSAFLSGIIFLSLSRESPPTGGSLSADPPQALPTSLIFIQTAAPTSPTPGFRSFGGPFRLVLAPDAIWITLPVEPSQAQIAGEERKANPAGGDGYTAPARTASFELKFIGANESVRLEPIKPGLGSVSIFEGPDPEGWLTGEPLWQGVRYANLYPGLDLELAGSRWGWQFTWIWRGSSRPPRPRLALSGAWIEPVDIESVQNGSLPIHTPGGLARLPLPASNLAWELHGRSSAGKGIQLELDPSEPRLALSTPTQNHSLSMTTELDYSTYLGGSLWDEASGIAAGPGGDIYLAGHTLSPGIPVSGQGESALHNVDAFVTRIDADTGGVDYLALLQGADLQNGEEWALGVVVDPQGNAYVSGRTNSATFPVTPGSFDPTFNGDWDVFAVKLSPVGDLIYSTFIGGDQLDWGTKITIDGDGAAYLTGGTFSTDFPVSAGAFSINSSGSRDIFITALNPGGTDILYSTYIGGGGQDQGEALAVLPTGAIYLTGWTNSNDFPTTAGAFAEQSSGDFEAFAVKLALDSPELVFSTYLGGVGEDRGAGVAVDPQTNAAIVAGRTHSPDFPTTPGAHAINPGGGFCDFTPCPDAFLNLLSPSGTLLYGTYLGGSNWDEAHEATVNEEGVIILTGETRSVDFPVGENGFDIDLGGERDGFFAAFEPPGYSLFSASYIGGSNWDAVNASTAQPDGILLLAGRTLSSDFPITSDAFSKEPAGDYDAFAVRLVLKRPGNLYLPLITQ